MVIVLGDLDDDGSGVGLNAQACISVHACISFDKDIGDGLDLWGVRAEDSGDLDEKDISSTHHSIKLK